MSFAAVPENPKHNDIINHPDHYGGADNPYEAIKVIEAWGLGFCLGNCLKYIARAGRKTRSSRIEDLRKASWYLNRQIEAEGAGTANLVAGSRSEVHDG